MSIQKYKKKAKSWAKLLGRLPGVRAIFLSGSLAQDKGTKNSDIDFFIIAKSGQIWTARFFIFVVLKTFRQLAKPDNHSGKICPNHFITDQNLEIQEKDEYAAHLFSHNIPLYDPKNIFPLFVEINREWITLITNDELQITNKKKYVVSDYVSPSGRTWGRATLETFLKNLQIKKIKNNPEYQTLGAKIILNDTELRFHPKPKNLDFKP